MRPTPEEVDAVLFDMIAAQAAQVPHDTSLDDFWGAEAVNPQGEVGGYRLGHTPAEARATDNAAMKGAEVARQRNGMTLCWGIEASG